MQDNPIRAIHNFIASNGTILPSVVRSRSASVPKDDARVTEMINGILVTHSAKKVTNLPTNPVQEQRVSEPEPKVIDLQEYAKSGKAGSVSGNGINKLKAIHDFITSNGRI